MWLWTFELRRLGFRRLSDPYWQCERRYGLPARAYLSVFAHARETGAVARPSGHERIDVCAFHVTFDLGADRVHFYYHELTEKTWEPGGHTSAAEIRRYTEDPGELREIADGVAAEFLAALGIELLPRGLSWEAAEEAE